MQTEEQDKDALSISVYCRSSAEVAQGAEAAHQRWAHSSSQRRNVGERWLLARRVRTRGIRAGFWLPLWVRPEDSEQRRDMIWS